MSEDKSEQATGNGQRATGNAGSGSGQNEQATANDLRRGGDLAERLLIFAVDVLRLARRVPKDFAGRHIATQLIRSATSGGANYEEARGAESRADFVHKVGVAAKEVREAIFWLKLLQHTSSDDFDPILHEAHQLAAMLVASARTARRNA